MSISIYNSSGIINIIQSLSVPRSYFQCSGSSKAIGSDYVQIQIDKDTYDVLWSELDIDGNIPESQYAALYMLAQVFANVPVIPPAPPPNLSLTVANSSNFDIPAIDGSGAGQFSIQWGAKMTSDDNHPRSWSFGSFPDAAHAVSIENGTLYYWINGAIANTIDISGYSYIGNWTYFVVTRGNNGKVKTYIDGNDTSADVNVLAAIPTQGKPLYLGSEGNDSLQNGLMSDFVFINGAYWNDIVPAVPLTPTSETKLLIFQGNTLPLEITDNSGLGNIVTNGTGIYNIDSPFAGYEGSIQFGTI
jgi:hypothetical protein